jgi:purine nucleosidase
MRIHLDTDIGGDTDDLCALAMLLGSEEVELVGITTCGDRRGGRAAFVRHALRLAGREDVPVASGAFGFVGGFEHEPGVQDERYWPGLEAVQATAPGAALDLLLESAAAGAMVVAIGPYTNLAVAEAMRPGVLGATEVVVMGGNTRMAATGLPQWAANWDYNVQADALAAQVVFDRVAPLIVPIEVSLEAWLQRKDLARLRTGGPLAQLIARQGELYAEDNNVAEMIGANPGLPGDLLNFQHDPLACAAALGWDCVEVSEVRLSATYTDGLVRLEKAADGPIRRIVTGIDGEAFRERWLAAVLRVRGPA